MALDLSLFKGLPPYASELFGVYQPLLGWKSKRKRRWIGRQQAALIASAVSKMQSLAPSRSMLQAAPRPLVASDLMSHAIEPWADTVTGRALQTAAISFVSQSKRLPTADEWKLIAASAALDKVLARIAKTSKRSARQPRAVRPSPCSMKRQ